MKRRMIATDLVSEGRFLRMSLTAQALYMHLLANADDDGCVDAYTITRMIGAKEDDLVLLKEREYVTILDEKEYILWITGWQDFNWIDARYKEDSKYLPLLRAKVEGVEIVESTKKEYNRGRYAKRKMEKELGTGSAHVLHMGSTSEALVGTPLRIGKERLGENTTGAQPPASLPPVDNSPKKGKTPYATAESLTATELQRIADLKGVSLADVRYVLDKVMGWPKAHTVKDWNLTVQSWLVTEIREGKVKVRAASRQDSGRNPYVEPEPAASSFDTDQIRRDLSSKLSMR